MDARMEGLLQLHPSHFHDLLKTQPTAYSGSASDPQLSETHKPLSWKRFSEVQTCLLGAAVRELAQKCKNCHSGSAHQSIEFRIPSPKWPVLNVAMEATGRAYEGECCPLFTSIFRHLESQGCFGTFQLIVNTRDVLFPLKNTFSPEHFHPDSFGPPCLSLLQNTDIAWGMKSLMRLQIFLIL